MRDRLSMAQRGSQTQSLAAFRLYMDWQSHFPITTSSPEAQRYIDQAGLAYGFNHAVGDRLVQGSATLDPVAMCFWANQWPTANIKRR
jgi:hypothetical protein